MTKIIINTTGSSVFINDVGVMIPANYSYTIPPQNYLLWAASSDINTFLDAGTLVGNDGINDLPAFLAKDMLQHDRFNNLTNTSFSPRPIRTTTTSNGTYVLTNISNYEQVAIGTATGYKYKLPDARTLTTGWTFKIFNRSAVPVSIVYDDLTSLYQIAAQGYAEVTLEENSTNDGLWMVVASNLADIDLSNPDFTGVKDGFEDFMFDAYAGAGGNDNQYSFTVVTNNGSSDIDGLVSVVGNDYEGIHILNSLTSASSRPMVEAFNLINRIKLGAQPESYEIRVRIETLADITQKFTTRYGLMDVDTIGLPANGVIFSYDPIYPVTPVAQVVTATPNVSSQAATQDWIQTVNGIDYDFQRKVNQVINITPNSFPVATYQLVTVTITAVNSYTYSYTVNGTTVTFTSDSTATRPEIATGLSAAINGSSQGSIVLAAVSGNNMTITSKVLGLAFTHSNGANLVSALTTANVPVAIYTETIAGVPYAYTSDGTPTASDVVTGLTALINADSGCPATASGTTVLILTSKTSGTAYTYSGTSNLTQANVTIFPTATEVCNGLRALMASDFAVNVSGTTTLIMTAKVTGNAFTYSGSSNLTEVLTTANVPQVFYSGNWICSVIKNSTATTINSGIPVVANQWYRLKAVIKADGTSVFFYIDSLFIDEVVAPVPLVALRYIFKLEKTVGTTSRTTSIDYITWRRTRG